MSLKNDADCNDAVRNKAGRNDAGRNDAGRATRRLFLGAGTAAAFGAALGAAAPASAEDRGDDAPAAWLDVRRFGAAGDGEQDDTEAVRSAVAAAKARRIGTVLLPAGVYLLSDVLKLPSNLRLVGAGAGLTTLRAVEGTLFPMFRPDPRTQEIRQRRTMLTTESVGSAREQVVENLVVAHLTIDWNHCPTGRYGASVALLDSADHCLLQDVAFERCLPSDHPRTLEEMSGSAFRSECVMFSGSRHGRMEGCSLVDSGYRPLSVSYGSRDIVFRGGRITASRPVWRHAFAEVHGDGIPRDDRFVRSEMKLLDSTFVLEGGTAQDGICAHTGSMHVENCDFHIAGGTQHLATLVKPFDGSRNCAVVHCRFHCRGEYEAAFGIIGSVQPARPDNLNLTFAGNVVDADFSKTAAPPGRGLVDFTAGDRRVSVRDNQFHVRLPAGGDAPVIRIRRATGFSVSGNLIEIDAPSGDGGAAGVTVAESTAGAVTGNVVTGGSGEAFRLLDKVEEVTVASNVPGA